MKMEHPPGAGVSAEKSSRILVVDDDASVRYICAEALKAHDVLQAENGREALNVMAGNPVDVVLTDVMMPEMNGLELLEAVRKKEPNQIVVVMTSFAEKEVVLKALKGGADDFIEKPIDMLMARSVVERALEKKRLREELFHLKQIDKLKSDFLGLISHKLKTPITIISLSTQILAEKAENYPDPSFSKNLEATREQTAYLVTLIEELLRFSDAILQEEKLQLKTTDPKIFINACVEAMRDRASRRNIEIEARIDTPLPALMLDGKRIEFALHALLDNAVKFTPDGGKVTVETSTDGRHVIIAVGDTGPGIPVKEQAKVFEKFYQIDPDYTGQVRGFGLGLFYARQFVREHGGSLELQSAPEAGTTLTVTLPIPAR
jgi:signal transduction histidine kinase